MSEVKTIEPVDWEFIGGVAVMAFAVAMTIGAIAYMEGFRNGQTAAKAEIYERMATKEAAK